MDEESSPILSEKRNDLIEDGVKIDTSKVQKKFEQSVKENISHCTICGKHVYQMEKVKAEKRLYHKTCFRCKECNKQLNVDTYNSHESQLYCQLHFKLLFQPKANFDNNDNFSPRKQRKNEMIIRESVPQELPPDVIRCDSKLDDGLNGYQLDLSNIKQRFELGSDDRTSANFSLSDTNALQRSESLLVRLQRYQSAITGERRMSENNCETSSPEVSDDEEGSTTLLRETKDREKVPFTGLSSLKSQWETGNIAAPFEQVNKSDDTKEQLYKLRQRICLGRSASMRQVYENACNEKNIVNENRVNGNNSRSNSLVIETQVKAQSLREKFEAGHVSNDTEEEEKLRKLKKEKEDDLSVVIDAETTAREAKSIFKQMDERNAQQRNVSPLAYDSLNNYSSKKFNSLSKSNSNKVVGEVVKCSDPTKKEEVVIETSQLQERFKFFESYKEPEAEQRKYAITPPLINRNDEYIQQYLQNGNSNNNSNNNNNSDEVDTLASDRYCSYTAIDDIPKTDTAKKMLNKFKQLESQVKTDIIENTGPKPLKRITPPRDYEIKNNHDNNHTENGNGDANNDHDDDDDYEENNERYVGRRSPDRDPNIIRSSYKTDDIIPVGPEKARSLKEKFENWQAVDVENENRKNTSGFNEDNFVPRLDITKNLRAKFEAIKDENVRPLDKPKPKVNRFVIDFGGASITDSCNICNKRIYPMEKLEFSGLKMHKNCFKCSHCLSSLRLDNFTLAAQKLYCIAHFKQLFMAKGNYDEGFGREQHKEKWFNRNSKSKNNSSNIDTNFISNNNNDSNGNNNHFHDDINNNDDDDHENGSVDLDVHDDDEDDDDDRDNGIGNHEQHINSIQNQLLFD